MSALVETAGSDFWLLRVGTSFGSGGVFNALRKALSRTLATKSSSISNSENSMSDEPRHFRGYGRCIYCGEAPVTNDDLANEHVIPRGLNGVWVIDQASCLKWAKTINVYETKTMRQYYLGVRVHYKTKSRKKTRPSTFPLVRDYDGGKVKGHKDTEYVTIDEFPVFAPKLDLLFPKFYLGTPPSIYRSAWYQVVGIIQNYYFFRNVNNHKPFQTVIPTPLIYQTLAANSKNILLFFRDKIRS